MNNYQELRNEVLALESKFMSNPNAKYVLGVTKTYNFEGFVEIILDEELQELKEAILGKKEAILHFLYSKN